MTHNARAAVEERLHLRPGWIQPALGIPRHAQHVDPAAGGEQRIEVFAVVVRGFERVMFGEKHALQRRKLRIAEEELTLSLPDGEIERVGTRCRRILGLLAQLSKFGPLPPDIESQRRKPLDHLLELEQRALQRCEAAEAPPVERPPGTAGRSFTKGER